MAISGAVWGGHRGVMSHISLISWALDAIRSEKHGMRSESEALAPYCDINLTFVNSYHKTTAKDSNIGNGAISELRHANNLDRMG